MGKNKIIPVFLASFAMILLGGGFNVVASASLEWTDDVEQQNRILLSSAIHETKSMQSMHIEGIPYNDIEDKIIIASSKMIHETSGSMYEEGISVEVIEKTQMAELREKALEVKPAAGHKMAIMDDQYDDCCDCCEDEFTKY